MEKQYKESSKHPNPRNFLIQKITPKRESNFLPLDQYSCLGDGRTVAVIGCDGSCDWWCVPNMNSPPLFDRILDGDETGGFWQIEPEEPYSVIRSYIEGSLILETEYVTSTGRARVTDSLNKSVGGRLGWNEFARRIEGLEGNMTFKIIVKYGTQLKEANSWREVNKNATIWHLDSVMSIFRKTDNVSIETENDSGIRAFVDIKVNQKAVVAIIATSGTPIAIPKIECVDGRIDHTNRDWIDWSNRLTYDGPYKDLVKRSALTLKTLCYSVSGSIAAAATSCLPEGIGGEKNYDYRYAWVRDVCYIVKAFTRVGAIEEAQAAFGWLSNVVRKSGSTPEPMYTIDGEKMGPEEEEVDITGYRNSKPVRRGNRAASQDQFMTFGDLLETAWLFCNEGHALDTVTSSWLITLVDKTADMWRKKDSGIWELEEEQHYTTSKIGCWTALDRGVKLAKDSHIRVEREHWERWEREKGRLMDWIDKNCWSEEKQSYTQYSGTEKLDASLLLATRFKYPRKEKLDLTRIAIQKELAIGPLVYRYSGMQKEEGCFIACCFWLVEACAFLGYTQEARKVMAELVDILGNNLGLLNEMIDPFTKEMLGNFPQGLSHLALIHAASSIMEAESGDTL